MTDFASQLQSGNAWLFIPSAVLLGALHGLEPGHSKTMMAAFIVAVRGTVFQAALLGLAATFSHTIIVWVIALLGLWLGQGIDVPLLEPWLQVASGVIILAIAAWMMARILRDRSHSHHLPEGHPPDHSHPHDHFHLHPPSRSPLHRILFRSRARAHTHENLPQAHQHTPVAGFGHQHMNKNVTTGQIVAFGFSGGLIPCPASVTVLLLCLQLEKFALGATLVLSFSVGMALTMVASGVFAAMGFRQVSKRWKGLGSWINKLPYLSGFLIFGLGIVVLLNGLDGLKAPGRP